MQEEDIIARLDTAFDKLCLAPYASKLPTFSGDTGAGSFMDFLNKFNEIGNIMGLQKVTHLEGTAKAVFENFSAAEKRDWQIATTKLQQYFSTDHFLDMAREKLMNMRMETGESPVVLSNRVRKEILEAYPKERKFLQTLVFTNALSDPVKQKLKLLGPLPTQYDKLVQEAERMWNLITTDHSYITGDALIAKIDQVLDDMSYPMSSVCCEEHQNKSNNPTLYDSNMNNPSVSNLGN
ncbi:hypothetical protein OSTOST_01987, partial [Ostertagia ostertagi]